LTPLSFKAHNRLVVGRNRSSLASLLAGAVLLQASLSLCRWDLAVSPDAALRGAEVHCHQQATVNDCCWAGERDQDAEVLAAAVVSAPATGIVGPMADEVGAAARSGLCSTSRALGSQPRTHLLLSVFLI